MDGFIKTVDSKQKLALTSTMKVYRSAAALVAILILATPGAYSYDVSQIWGWPKPGDIISRENIYKEGKWWDFVQAGYRVTISNKVNCMKFWDHAKTGAKIAVKKEPPCYNPEFSITSRRGRGFNFTFEAFFEK